MCTWVWRRFGAVFDLAGEDIAYQLAELDGIAGAAKALCCHRGHYAIGQRSARGGWVSNFTTTGSPRHFRL
jgi:hypothetical protein